MAAVLARVLEIFTVYRTVKARALTRSAETLRRMRAAPCAAAPAPRCRARALKRTRLACPALCRW
jgi:hypothetical protein